MVKWVHEESGIFGLWWVLVSFHVYDVYDFRGEPGGSVNLFRGVGRGSPRLSIVVRAVSCEPSC